MNSKNFKQAPRLVFLVSILILFQVLGCREQFLTIEGREVPTEKLVPTKQGVSARQLYAESKKIMIATDSVEASQAGLEIFRKGGNTVDVIVAASFAVSVTRPQSTGIGGGGFLLYHDAKTRRTFAYDFRERAPKSATRDMYKGKPKEDSLLGLKSVGVPGTVAGLLRIHKQFGKLSLPEILAPSIRLAESGFPVYSDLQESIRKSAKDMSDSMREIFLPEGRLPNVGQILIQKDLAKALKLIAQTGEAEFYHGQIATAFEKQMKTQGGDISKADLENYKVRESKPLEIQYRGYTIQTMTPPSSGIHMLTMLRMLETKDLKGLYDSSPSDFYHFLSEVMRRGYADRAVIGGDPSYTKIPTEKLLSTQYAKEKISDFNEEFATPSSTYLTRLNLRAESDQTTHISVIDSSGNAVSTTQSVNFRFGSGTILEGYGFVLNDTMDDFSRSPGEPNVYGLIGAEANSIQPGKTPLSSMSPTIVLKGGESYLATGAPGGSYIVNAVLQSIVFNIDLGVTLYESVARGRVHHQFFPDALYLEGSATDTATFNQLKAKKHDTRIGPNFAKLFSVKRENGTLYGASDPRGDGVPLGE
ncbi:gamma-glutamyltransferase [Leptospira perolatii]|uniref:Glutathione hydrolase proenzyme n=1 Tax=Leptospira perolatii TaxID=2023191 RepID=A0A2M9ZJI7_9LEPT|nr:gamma-glutamyltransferase [Leptospira perolatii]PJZ68563.1 gamma-glutamyltransferase [Leptospira perolatii]PJZ72218.1 gamma-glutamyltransferase [Leptospira perolatii]